jgi:hypothetical protein
MDDKGELKLYVRPVDKPNFILLVLDGLTREESISILKRRIDKGDVIKWAFYIKGGMLPEKLEVPKVSPFPLDAKKKLKQYE